ncbi:histone-lysine N-methyltransferase NSD2 [Neosynchiropus ocellatus]
MDSKGSSLPSMPEPVNPIGMKQPPESLGLRKCRVDMSSEPSLLMDKAAAQLAATLQDGVLQKMSSHNHNNHETLKDLTSLVLNGDQDAIPMLVSPEAPILKVASNGGHQLNGAEHDTHELKVTIPLVVNTPQFEPCCANGTGLPTAFEAPKSVPEQREDVKKKKGRPLQPKPELSISSSDICMDSLDGTLTVKTTGAADELGLIQETTQVSPLMIRFSVGDVVWTKVSGYPWWPCIVTTDPEHDNHIKQKQKAATSRSGLLYHVQYFGDAPERGYIFEKNIVAFTDENQYEELSLLNKRSLNHVVHKKTAPSVPRKLQAQWNMGIVQAKEAIGMSLDERMAHFKFRYDDDGPHLNPHIQEKLVQISATNQEAELRISPALSAALPGSLSEPAAATQDSTTSSTNVIKRGKGHVNKSTRKKAKDPAKAALKQQQDVKDPDSTASDLLSQTVVPAKKRARPKKAEPATKSVKRKKSSLQAVESTTKVKKERKKSVKRLLTSDKEDQPPKKRKTSKNQSTTAKGTEKKQRRRKSTNETTTMSSTGDKDGEKPKYRRKRKLDGESQVTTSKAKKRRTSPCLEAEGSGSEGRPDSPSESLDGIKKGERRKEFVCQLCEQPGEGLLPCEGQCSGMFHLSCLGLSFKPEEKLLCGQCSTGVHSCFTCKQSEGEVRRCHVAHCGKFYHESCVGLSPLTVFDNKGFRCPLHTCLSCHFSSHAKHKSHKGRLMRCLRCPVAYHVGDLCVAAGSELITSSAIICTNHFNAKKGYSHHSHVNVSWCFVCSKGSLLLCCESCPAAFHPDCLNIAMPDGSWFCNDCRAGKKPKYHDIIWVKLGKYRWWPAEIHHPRTIPTNIQHLRHEIGEFPVFFFGSKDYFWTHQGRVFPYMEGDRGSKCQRSGIWKVFKNALLEAEARFSEIKMKREAKEAEANNKKPPPYKFIKVNKPVGRVQVYTADISEIPKCNCKPSDERPCGFESECLNRMLLYECHPQVCPNGERCCNQDFTKRLYPETKIIKTPGKGWGLISLRDIKKGEFVNEYIGELIDEDECRARIKYAHENNITDFYMLTIDKDRIIDAGPKGNFSRFMNHSCQPNCETQKWTVNGDTRVGLFAVCDIPAGTELTFNYNLDCLGNEKTVCRCGAPNCSGFLGDRPKNGHAAEPKGKRGKRKLKKRRAEGKKSDDECFRCGDGGQLVICGKKTCTKAYHLSCLNLSKRPFGRWDCPWHHCDVCGKNSEAFCQLCPNSFCKIHQEGALHPWTATGQLCCQEHEEMEVADQQNQAADADTLVASSSRAPKASKKPKEPKIKNSKRKTAEA